jgi:hypothetical protein
LAQLHKTIQAVFGWSDYHLHQYVIDGRRYALPDPEYADELPATIDERDVTLRGILGASTIVYEYDFGDDWKHLVQIESVAVAGDPSITYPVCTGGARACPREDCGGTSGYARLLEILGDPMHEEYREMKTWVEKKYDPEKFDLVAIERVLRKLRKRPAGSRRGPETRK